jgi:hypothetical protein
MRRVAWKQIKQRLRGRHFSYEHLHPIKLRALDAAFQRRRVNSFADLGGVWAVDGGYTFYALEVYSCSRAVLVDEHLTRSVVSRAKRFRALTLRSENFGSDRFVATLGHVDAILLFDVLLHQVRPNWDAILRMYAPVTDCFVIVNPQYVNGPETIRLLDLEREQYHSLVPAQPGYEDLFERSDEFLPSRGRYFRDIHNVWQWGIVDTDLHGVVSGLGFAPVYFENGGQWGQQSAFENHAFVFSKSPAQDAIDPGRG